MGSAGVQLAPWEEAAQQQGQQSGPTPWEEAQQAQSKPAQPTLNGKSPQTSGVQNAPAQPSFYKPVAPQPASVEAAPEPGYFHQLGENIRNSVVGRALGVGPTISEAEEARTGQRNDLPDVLPQWAKQPLASSPLQQDPEATPANPQQEAAANARLRQAAKPAASYLAAHPKIKAAGDIAEAVNEGVGQTAEGLTSPASLALIAAAPESKAITAIFAGQAAKGSFDSAEKAYQAWRAGNNPEAAKDLTESGLNAVVAGLAGKHFVEGAMGEGYRTLPPNPTVEIPGEPKALPAPPQPLEPEYVGQPPAAPQAAGIPDAEVTPWEEARQAQLPAKAGPGLNPPPPVNPSTAVTRTAPPTQFAPRPEIPADRGVIVDAQGNALPVRPGLPLPGDTAGRKTPIIPKPVPAPAQVAPTPQLATPAVMAPPQAAPAQVAPNAPQEEQRPVVQASTEPEQIQQSAEQQKPVLKDMAHTAVEGIPGAKVEAMRVKEPEAVENKEERGKPPETITDHLGARVSAPTPEAVEQVKQNIESQLPVHSSDKITNNGVNADQYGVQTGLPGEPNQVSELQVVTAPVAKAMKETDDLYDQQKKALAAGDQAKADELGAQITAKMQDAQQPENQNRRALSESPEQTQLGNPAPLKAGDAVTYPANSGKSRNGKIVRVDGDSAYVRDGFATVKKPLSGLKAAGAPESSPPAAATPAPGTPPATGDKWIGVDLDGTLAKYDGFKGKTVIGEPIPAMVDRIKQSLADGNNVKILTARVHDDPTGEAKKAIQDWTEKHLGKRLDVTDVKDPHMTHLYDDRAVPVERNTGRLLAEPQPEGNQNANESGNGGQPSAVAKTESVGKEQPGAIREPKAEGVLQRQPEENAGAGRERGRVESGQQGNEPARESAAAEEKPLAREGGGEKPEEVKPTRSFYKPKAEAAKPVKREPIAGTDGKATTVLTPTRDLPAKYRVVEADDLLPSHNAQTFAKNPEYPEGLQERAYDTSKEAQNRVIQQAQNYDPRYTLNTNPDAVNGPPVVTPDGLVLGGNSRAMSTQRLYAQGGDAYKSALKEQAASYGLKAGQFDAMKKPVLVREIAAPATPDEARRIGSELNKSMTGALGVSERAVSAGKNLKPDTLRSVANMMQADDSTLREAMGKHGAEIVKMLTADGVITERERPQFVDAKTGGLSEEGKTFVERALMGSVIDDPRLMDAAPKSVLQKLERSLGSITSFASRADEWNLLPAIRDAVSELGAIQRAGSNVDLWTGQTSLFGGERNPLVDAVIRTLDEKPNTVRKAFDDFARDADQNLPGQARFFGKADAFDAFNSAFGSKLSEQEYHDGLEEAATKEPNTPAGADAQGDKGVSERPAGDAARSGEGGKEAGKLGPTLYSGGFLDPELFKTLFPNIAEQFKNWATDEVTPGDEQREMMRQTRGERDRQIASIAKKLQKVRNSWTFRPRSESMDFFNAVESGNINSLDPKDRALAQFFKGGFDPIIQEIQALKPQALQTLIQNYFPHIWEQPSMAGKTLGAVMSGRRPFAGSGSFLKQRTIPTMQDGIDMGLKPVSWNPVDLFLRKYAEMSQFLMGHKTLEMMKDAGTAKMVRVGEKPPDGWQQLDDRIGTIYSYDDEDHLFIRGHYYAAADAAKVFNNFVSRGIRGRSAIYDTLRWANDNMNSLQLGISAFHASTTAINAATSEVALAIEQLSQGKPLQAAGHLLSGATVAPSVIRTMVNGSRMMSEYLEPGSYRKFAAEASAVAEAGGRAKMDSVSLPAFRKTVNAFRNGAIGEGLLSLPGTMLQSTIAPVMEWMVPRMKMGAFYDMAHNVLDQADRNGWDADVVRRNMQRAWDSIDNRFGQLVYENLFWHRALQDTLMLASRSVGWNFGDLRELGGGAKDTAQQAAKVLQGEAPEVTPRMAFAMALPLVTGLVGAALTYLWTGKGPETWKDYFYPKRQDGTRVSIPGYMKDVVSAEAHPVNTVVNKMSPILEMTAEAINNRDFYGTEIRHKDDPYVKQLLQVGRWAGSQAEPFAISGAQKLLGKEGEDTTFSWAHPVESTERIAKAAAKHPGDVALGQLGFQPAPAAIQNSPALNMARDYSQENRPSGTRTQEQTDKSQAMHTIEDMYRSGNVDKGAIQSMIQNGTISERDRFHAQLYARQNPLVTATKALHVDQAVNVYLAATPEEQKALRPVIETKQREIDTFTNNPDERAKLKDAYRNALHPQAKFTGPKTGPTA